MTLACGRKTAIRGGAALLTATAVAGALFASQGTAHAARETAGAATRTQQAAGPKFVLVFKVKNLPAEKALSVIYTSGVQSGQGGTAVADSGAILSATLVGNAVVLLGSGGPLDATVTEYLTADGAQLSGTATVPPGTDVTVTNPATHQTVTLTGGPFSVGTSLSVTGQPAPVPVTTPQPGAPRRAPAA
jgi:hypothetical protein